MNKIKTKHNKVVTSTYALFKNLKFQKVLSLLMSLLLAFSPVTYATGVDYLIGTLGNAFTGKLEGGAALFEIESGRIGANDESRVNHPNVEMAGNIAKIIAGTGNSAYFVIDGAHELEGSPALIDVSMNLKGHVGQLIDGDTGLGYWRWENVTDKLDGTGELVDARGAGITYGNKISNGDGTFRIENKGMTISFVGAEGLDTTQLYKVFNITQSTLKIGKTDDIQKITGSYKNYGLNVINEGGTKLLGSDQIGQLIDSNTGLGYWRWENVTGGLVDARGAGITYGDKISNGDGTFRIENKGMTVSFKGAEGLTSIELYSAFTIDVNDRTVKVIDKFKDRDLGLSFIDENLNDSFAISNFVDTDKALKLAATIIGAHTAISTADGKIDGRMNKYTEVRTYDDNGLLWRTSTIGIRGGDVVNSTTFNGYDPLTGELRYSYSFGKTNGAVSNYVESFTYNNDGLVQTTIRSGMVGGDMYGDGNLITNEDEDYVTTNMYDTINGATTLSGIAVTGNINGRKSAFARQFVYDSLGRTTETRYAAMTSGTGELTDYVLVNGAFYGGSLPTGKYKESTKYNSDGSVASTIIEGRIDGMKNSYTQSFQYSTRGQVFKTITDGTVRGNTYSKLEETNLIKNKESTNVFSLVSDINSGRTMGSITNGHINGAVSDVVTRYDYDNDGMYDTQGPLNPFAVLQKDRVGRQLATYTRGVRDATYYGDGETEYRYTRNGVDYTGAAYFEARMKYESTTYKLSDDLDENVSFVSFSEYNNINGQVKKTITGIRIKADKSVNPLAQDIIKGGMINRTENYYATVYTYDDAGLGREKKTATRGIRGGRFYGLLDGDNTVENLTWDAGVQGEVVSGADYVEANTYYGLADTIFIDITGDGVADDITNDSIVNDDDKVKYADSHLFRLKSTRTTGWTDGEVNDYVRLLDYDNDGVGITWNGGNLSSDAVLAKWEDTGTKNSQIELNEIIVTGTSQDGDGRVARTITSGMVSARCYGNACDASTAENFDLESDIGKNYNFSFANDTADIYQEVNSYDSQGRVVFAKNLGLINSAKDNYRIDYFYESGKMAGRQLKSVINSKAIGEGNAVVSASVRVNYVEETDYDDNDNEEELALTGRGLRVSTKVTGYDSGAFNDYIQLFEYQNNTDSINYESVAGRMKLVRYRGMRGSSVNGYIADPEIVPLNTALNKLEDTSIWNKKADFIQILFYAGANSAEHRAGQQTRIDTEGTSGGSSNSYATLNSYDALGRQKERKIQGEHAFSKLNLIQEEDTNTVDWDSNAGAGFGIVGGQFTKTNERMEYFANGQLKWIINEGGFSETVEEGNIYGGQDNNKRIFSYDNVAKDENDFYGRDIGFSYDVVDPNGDAEAPRVGGNWYYGFNKIIEETTGGDKKLNNECSENCNYEIKYSYDSKGQRETQHSWGWIINRANTPKTTSVLRNTAQLDDYTTLFKYNGLGQTLSTSYNIGALLRGNTYGVAPVDMETGKKIGVDREYITTYSYNDLGWQTKQQSIGYRGQSGQPNFDNFTRTNLLEYTFADKFKIDESDPESNTIATTGKTYRNNWGRVVDSRIDGIYGGATYESQSQNFSPDALRLSMFDGLDDGKDPLPRPSALPGDDDNPLSYDIHVGETYRVYITGEDGIQTAKNYKVVNGFGIFSPDGPNGMVISVDQEYTRRVVESVAGKLINLTGAEVDYGDMYKGARPCVRQTDGTLNCAH